MNRYVKSMAVIIILSTFLTGCTQNTALKDQLKAQEDTITKLTVDNKVLIDTNNTLTNETKVLTENMDSLKSQSHSPSLLSNAVAVLDLLKAKDFEGLSTYIDATKGVRFSSYANINIATDKVFTKAQITAIAQDSTLYTWGSYDGSGEPITLNFNDYYNKFIYDKDFINPSQIGYMTSVSSGNTVDNLTEVYPEGNFVEFYHPGTDPSGLDWASLKLVFENVQGNWVLVGIVHAQWTI